MLERGKRKTLKRAFCLPEFFLGGGGGGIKLVREKFSLNGKKRFNGSSEISTKSIV